MAFVYVITNNKTGKRYVGFTNKTLEQRWSRHCSHAAGDGQCLLHKAMRKHGFDAFKIEMLEECADDVVLDAEKRWINQLGTFMPAGYNMTLGGDGVLGRIVPDDERARRSQASQKRYSDPSQREQARAAKTWKMRRVEQSDMTGNVIKVWKCYADAARSTGVKHIRDCCNGKRHHAGGFKWRWLDPSAHVGGRPLIQS